MFKVIIAGSREFNNYPLLKKEVDDFLKEKKPEDIQIVSGTARGADILGEQYAQSKNLSIKRFPANWKSYGRSAGPIRNAEMADYADACIVFWDGRSPGTKSMIDLAVGKGLEVKVVTFQ